MKVWVLVTSEDYGQSYLQGVFSSPELAIAGMGEGIDWTELSVTCLDAPETILPSFEIAKGADSWTVCDIHADTEIDAQVKYMLELCSNWP